VLERYAEHQTQKLYADIILMYRIGEPKYYIFIIKSYSRYKKKRKE